MNANTDRIAHWFVSGLELEATVFHVGQYCGPWRASTAGRERASFHLVLRGHSWLHLDGQAPIRLGEREGVFLLRDIPHRLSPDADDTDCRPCDMRPMTPAIAGACGLACGFFSFRGQLGELFRSALPDYVNEQVVLTVRHPVSKATLAELAKRVGAGRVRLETAPIAGKAPIVQVAGQTDTAEEAPVTTENTKKETKQLYSKLLDDATSSAITSVQNDVMK